jgi:hypothetical protein
LETQVKLRVADNFPPGWLPLSMLDDMPTWSEFREIKDRVVSENWNRWYIMGSRGIPVIVAKQSSQSLAAVLWSTSRNRRFHAASR